MLDNLKSPWHDETVRNRVMGLMKEGYSAAITAVVVNREFGVSITRNAILGKMFRDQNPEYVNIRRNREEKRRERGRAIARAVYHPETKSNFDEPIVPIKYDDDSISSLMVTEVHEDLKSINNALREVSYAEKVEPLEQDVSAAPPFRDTVSAVMSLKPKQCRYVYGSPVSGECSFCSNTRIEDKSYCKTHYKLAYKIGYTPPHNPKKRVTFAW